MSTRLELCQSVCSQSGIANSNAITSTTSGNTNIYADVIRWVDEAYNEIQTRHEKWNFLHSEFNFTLTNTNNEYTPTTENIRKFDEDNFKIELSNGNIVWLSFVPYSYWRSSPMFDQTTSGTPQYVTILPNGNLRFYPTADDDYTIYGNGYTRPDTFSADDDVPVFPEQYHHLILYKALSKYASYYNSPEMYQDSNAQYMMEIKRMERSELPYEQLSTLPLA